MAQFQGDFLVETADSASEAMEIIEELASGGTSIILIVSDWLMPEMLGDEFLEKVHKKYPGIVKIILTGHANEEAIEKAKKNANLFKCIHKPWSKEELINTIKEGLKKI